MAHSVKSHLEVDVARYDEQIRAFVWGYEALMNEAADALVRHLGEASHAHVLDLGAGTGALTHVVAKRLKHARFTLLDADVAMIDQAKARLSSCLDRVTFVAGSFLDPLPACDAAMASLSLHHVRDRETKRALYANIRSSLVEGGILVSADAMVSSGPLRARTMQRWAEHLMAHGDSEAEAYARFAKWADEDFYFSIDDELAMLREAGFVERDIAWRSGPTAVAIAIR